MSSAGRESAVGPALAGGGGAAVFAVGTDADVVDSGEVAAAAAAAAVGATSGTMGKSADDELGPLELRFGVAARGVKP